MLRQSDYISHKKDLQQKIRRISNIIESYRISLREEQREQRKNKQKYNNLQRALNNLKKEGWKV